MEWNGMEQDGPALCALSLSLPAPLLFLFANSRRYPTLAGRAAPQTAVASEVNRVVSQAAVPLLTPPTGHMPLVIWEARPSWA